VAMLQLVLMVVGAGALVLGAASTALRENHAVLAERHRELARKNGELAALAEDLRQVSQRLVRVEEQGQRELAAELDYELGHAIHALGTRISLAFREVRDEQNTRLLESLREQVREIQDSLRRALRQLRPPMLDSHGLRHALENGPLRDMLDDAGVEFVSSFEGRLDALDDDLRTAVYRICQTAVREAVRLEMVRQVGLQLELAGQRLRVAVDIEYSPYTRDLPPLQALAAIRDRVLAEHGSYVVEPLVHGQRHCVEFTTP
jgi:glucose-6-phosphate-specific signal transduction histidine kinase